MTQLIVRNVDERVAAALKRRAARNGRSAEAEHRAILGQVLLTDEDFKRALATMPDVGDDADFARIQDLGRPIEL